MSAAGWYWALLPTVWLTAWWVCIIAIHPDRSPLVGDRRDPMRGGDS